MTAHINRPWIQSFNFDRCYDDVKLDQLHKLTRNFVASLDLGCLSAKHVADVDRNVNTDHMDERAKYLLWVKTWKKIYAEVSKLIRRHKLYRRTTRKLQFTLHEGNLYSSYQSNLPIKQYYRSLSERQLGRLQETAMVLLNARYNAKLASAERRRRLRERNGNASVSTTEDTSSNLVGATIAA
jgi:hypothetical protein